MTKTAFRIFTGKGKPHKRLQQLPDAPPWRRFVKEGEEQLERLDPTTIRRSKQTRREIALATRYQVDEQNRIVDAVNAALHLRRPLLITGPAGTGKSSLAYAAAYELQLGQVLEWNITSKSTLREGLYDYDALGRLQAIQAAADSANVAPAPVADFVTLGPLGTALLPGNWPKALLIDEIDKADLDLPNDLLNVFEEGKFTIEELRRDVRAAGPALVRTYKGSYGEDGRQGVPGGSVACTVFPFVVLTSNGEREFSAPFLRRCVRLDLKAPDKGTLVKIVKAHLGEALSGSLEQEAQAFLDRRGEGKLSTDQLLNAIYLLEQARFTAEEKKALLNLIYRELQ
jgi:MoxR-like ATPase